VTAPPENVIDAGQAEVAASRGFALPLHQIRLTPVLLVFNILVYLLLTLFSTRGLLEAATGGADVPTLVLFGAKENHAIVQGEYWRLLTPLFLHIGLIHLLFNQFALSIFGRELERLFGTVRFAVIYFVAGMFGSLASFLFNPVVSAGASGAIFGIIGAQAVFFLRNREMLGEVGNQQFRSLMMLILINLALGFTIPGIDNYGHIGGLVAGGALGLLLAPTYALERLPLPPFARVVERSRLLPTALVAGLSLLLLALITYGGLSFAPLL
jgi:rhomboid protease GluP